MVAPSASGHAHGPSAPAGVRVRFSRLGKLCWVCLISSIDFAKTILNLTNIRSRLHSPFIQGVDLTPILKNPEEKVRESCLVEEDEEFGSLTIRLRHLITETHKITVYAGLEDAGDIYDRINDPDELNNLWDKDRDLKERLVTKLLHENLKAQSKIPTRQASS